MFQSPDGDSSLPDDLHTLPDTYLTSSFSPLTGIPLCRTLVIVALLSG